MGSYGEGVVRLDLCLGMVTVIQGKGVSDRRGSFGAWVCGWV